MGKILFMPTTQDRDRVRRLAAIGMSDEDIATQLRIPLKRLQKRYRRDLEEGGAEGNGNVLEKLYDMAKSGLNTTATIFWIKARLGWRDTGAPQNAAAQNWPPFVVNCHYDRKP